MDVLVSIVILLVNFVYVNLLLCADLPVVLFCVTASHVSILEGSGAWITADNRVENLFPDWPQKSKVPPGLQVWQYDHLSPPPLSIRH